MTVTAGEARRPGVFAASLALVVCAIVFGGASRDNPLRLLAVEATSLPLLYLILRPGLAAIGLVPRLLLAALFLIPLAQLTPLPPALWTRLADGAARATALSLLGFDSGWLPLSLAPRATLAAVPALFPPLALLLAGRLLASDDLRRLVMAWLAGALAGLLLGVAQIAEGEGGPAYLYAYANFGSVVGFFANRNHEAGYLLALLPLAAVLIGRAGLGRRDLAAWTALLFAPLAVVGLGVVKSRAGVLLAAPALALSAAVIWRTGGWRTNRRLAAIFAGLVLAAVLAVLAFGLQPILARFDAQAPAEFRYEAWPYIFRAAQDGLPFGYGVGAFDRVYRAVEPLALVGPAFFNHAHNEYLELWLETGWPGAAALVLFLGWFVMATVRAWRAGAGRRADLCRAASAAMALLLAQSCVDYPLRTLTCAGLFALCAGILLAGPGAARRARVPEA